MSVSALLQIPQQLTQILANQKTIIANQAQLLRWVQLIDQSTIPNNQAIILNWLKLISSKEDKIVDIVDTVLTQVQQLVTDMAALSPEIQTIIADLQAAATTGISPNDPRFQQLIASLQGVDSSITAGTAAISAALPPAPAAAAKP